MMSVDRKAISRVVRRTESAQRSGSSSSSSPTISLRLRERSLLFACCAMQRTRSLDLVLVGFSSLTHSQLALVRALVGRGAAVRLCAPVADLAGLRRGAKIGRASCRERV